MKRLTLVLPAILCASAILAAQTLDLSRYQIVDLSHAYGAGTLYWPTSTSKFKLVQESSGRTDGGYFYAAGTLSTPEHGGTHLDAPHHFSEAGRTTEQIPLEQLVAPAVVIDVTGAGVQGPRLSSDARRRAAVREGERSDRARHDRPAADGVEPSLAEREGVSRRRHAGRCVEAVVPVCTAPTRRGCSSRTAVWPRSGSIPRR